MENHAQEDEASADIWSAAYKIPWHEEGFSRRMLAWHLSQDTDLASRRAERIDAHVAWIHGTCLNRRPSNILDICCGPGLYLSRLAKLGHRGLGLDFGPASIDYAKAHNPSPDITFRLADVTTAEFGSGYDFAMMIYGEFNVFPPDTICKIMRKAHAALEPGGILTLEPQTLACVETAGRAPGESSEHPDGGLFSDGPHGVTVTNRWDEGRRVSVSEYVVREDGGENRYRIVNQAYTQDEIGGILSSAGFGGIEFHASFGTDDDDYFWTVTATKPE